MTLTAVLLVGGLSRRMGADKATLVLQREPLWARQIKLLREVTPHVWISARQRSSWCPPNVECVIEEPPSHGPLSGIVASLNRLQTSHLLVLAIDLPRMTAEQLFKLVAMAQNGRGIIPMNGEIFEPLCAVYPIEAAMAARTALAEKHFSLQRLSRVLMTENLAGAYAISPHERGFFHNANTPADLFGPDVRSR